MTDKQKKQGIVIGVLLLILYFLFGRKKEEGQTITFAKSEPIQPKTPTISTPPFVGGGGSFGGGGSSGGWSAAPKVNTQVVMPILNNIVAKSYTPNITPLTEKKSPVVDVKPLSGSGIMPSPFIKIPTTLSGRINREIMY